MPPSTPRNSSESCVLSLKDEESRHEGIATVTIDLSGSLGLESLCQELDIQIIDAINAAWGLTLFAYTALDVVIFGNTHRLCDDDTENIIATKATEIIRIEKTEFSTIVEVAFASKSSREEQKSSTDQQANYNTTIYFSEGELATTIESIFEARRVENPGIQGLLVITKEEAQISASLAFGGTHISQCQARNIASTFEIAWKQLINKPLLPFKDVELFNSRSLELIRSWNCTAPIGSDLLVHDSIRKKSLMQCGQQAICSWDGTLTYSELDQLSSRLAHHLVDLGARPESLIGICFDKSMWTVVAMLAILKAGAAFVPLNPSHPKARLQDLIDQMRGQIVLVACQYEELCKDIVSTVVAVTRDSIEVLPPHQSLPSTSVEPNNTAYAIFTSGSTGKPKGVVIEHRAASSSISSHGEYMKFGTQSRVLQFATYTFDACISEILTTLVYGGCICIPSDVQRISSLAETMRNMRVNWAFFTPTVLQTLTPAEVPELQTLVIGGEAVSEDDIMIWADKLCLIEAYGPTETTVYCTAHEFVPSSYQPTIIGKALGGLCWIVDPSDPSKLTAAGARGELLMESPALMRGYLGDAKRTGDVLIEAPPWRDLFLDCIQPTPKHAQCGSSSRPLLYKTGDMARYDSNGKLIYLGRKDTQVKLRGQRLELGEIEHHIKHRLPQIHVSAVELVTPGNRHPMLAAFLCLESNSSEDVDDATQLLELTDELRKSFSGLNTGLCEVLPGYQVPSLYLPLKTPPLSVSGKLDRGKLRLIAKELSHSQIETYSLVERKDNHEPMADECPSEVENTLQELWSLVLRLDKSVIGIHDSFFKLGADSVSAMKLSAFARRKALSLSVANIFRSEGDLRKMATLIEFDSTVSEEEYGRPEAWSLVPKDLATSENLAEISVACQVSPLQIRDLLPCTPLQEAMMALSAAQPGAYVAQYIFRLPEELNIELFKKAWGVVRERTEALRTRIVMSGKRTLQVITDEPTTWHSSSSLEKYLAMDRLAPLSYSKPLNRCGVLNQDGHSFFVWTAHHSVYDGYSFQLLLEQVHRACQGIELAHMPPMASLVSFLSNIDTEAAETFWKNELEEATPSSFPKTSSTSLSQWRATQAIEHSIQLPINHSGKITTTTLLRAAWAIVAARYSNADQDIVFGVTLSGRNAPIPGIDQLCGPTITTIPFRVRFESKTQTVSAFLECIQEQSTLMFDNPGFEHLGLQNIKRLNTHTSLACEFQSLLVVQPQTKEELFANKLGLELIESRELGYDSYVVVLECFLIEDKVNIRAVYDPDVMSHAQMRSLLCQVQHVFDQLITNTESQTIASIDLFSSHDKDLLQSWNSKEPECVDGVLHCLIQKHSQDSPESPAIHSWDGKMTFKELEDASDALAHELSNLGVGINQNHVPLCFEKSLWAVVSMVAVMKLGASFVPLSSALPPQRLKDICSQLSENRKLQVMLVSPNNTELCSDLAVNVISLSSASRGKYVASPFLKMPARIVTPDHAAYIIFTSGSTGTPKGVVLQHRAVSTSIMAHGKSIGFSAHSRTLQFCAYTFDVSVGEILTTLIFGGCCCIPNENERAEEIVKAINDLQVNLALLTPAVLKLFKPQDVPTLKTLVSGGESHEEECIKVFSENLNFIQAYGPTECSIICMTHTAKDILPDHSHSARNIGRGVGCRCWVVEAEDYHRLAPVGTVGELLIEGDGLAKEYLNDPEKTAASFIQNPRWSSQFTTRSRFYKTGDLVVQNHDGTLDFKGRKDGQMKLNGQRFEIGEIERHVTACAEVEHAAVFLLTKGVYTKRLTAVVSLYWPPQSTGTSDSGYESDNSAELNVLSGSRKQPGKTTIATLKTKLASVLPSYMVPTAWVILEKFPLNRSTKLDRPKVKGWLETTLESNEVEYEDHSTEIGSRQPETKAERLLQDAWSAILQMPKSKIGVETSFMALGGDSIAAIQVMWSCRKANLSVTVRDILSLQTIAKLAPFATIIADKSVEMPLEGSVSDAKSFCLLPQDTQSDKQKQAVRFIESTTGLLVEDIYQCTPMQQGLLISQIKNPELYRVELVFEVLPVVAKQPINIKKLHAAWSQIVQRHTILRSAFVQDASEFSPFSQVVFQNFEPRITSHHAETTPDIDAVLKLPPAQYDDSLPPHQLTICQMLDDSIVCKLEMSHTITDGSSLTPLLSDFVSAYDEKLFTSNAPPYRDYVEYLQNESAANGLAYWKNHLEGVRPCEFPRDTFADGKAVVSSVTIQDINFDAIQNSSCKLGITKSTIFRTVWALCLWLYVGRDEPTTFGFLTSGRDLPIEGIEEMIGPLMNMVVCCTELSADASLLQVLGTMQENFAECLQYQSTPLAEVHKELGLSGDTRLFNTILSYSRIVPTKCEDEASISLKRLADYDATEYDISVFILEEEGQLSGQLRYRADHISKCYAENVAHTFSRILAAIVANENQKVGNIDCLSNRDKEQIQKWNGDIPTRVESCVHNLISRHAITTPNTEAVASWDGNFTYQELDKLSSHLAYDLAEKGAQAGTYVPILFEKSKWTSVAMVAVLKTGAAFCPMDPSHPRGRLVSMLHDLGAQVLLASTLQGELLDGEIDTILTIDEEKMAQICKMASPSNWQPLVTHQDPAYLIYTSGSTGKPKGVIIEHGSYCSSAEGHREMIKINSSSRILQFASYSFDTSMEDHLTTLIVGGCICVPSEYERMNDIAGAINRMNVNWIHITPSVANLIPPKEVPSLKVMCLGGEAMTSRNIRDWSSQLDLINVYGPSEACVTCAVNTEPSILNPVNIGKSVSSVSWVVSPHDHRLLMPIGAPGELVVQGPITARGYLNDQAKTDASFITNMPWMTKQHSKRAYKTGDLVKYATDGTLIFIGRTAKDFQVKLHGQRIELAEVEHYMSTCLEACGEVGQIAVELVNFRGGKEPALAGFVAFTSQQSQKQAVDSIYDVVPETKDILARISGQWARLMAEYLPSFMIPKFVPLQPIPLTSSGKRDRRRLKEIATMLDDVAFIQVADDAKLAPETEMQKELQKLWAKVLHVQNLHTIGINDSFFRTFGGDSLSAMTLASACRASGFSLTVADIFRHPVLADMALFTKPLEESTSDTAPKPFSLLSSLTTRQLAISEASTLCEVSVEDIADIYPSTTLQEGLLALSASKHGAYMNQDVFCLSQDLDLVKFRNAWDLVYSELPILRTRIIQSSNESTSLQVVVNDQLTWQSDQVLEHYLSVDRQKETTFGTALARFGIVEENATRNTYFVLSIHHALYDGWSLPLMLSLVEERYFGKNTTTKTEPFNKFIRHLNSIDQKEQQDFWRGYLNNAEEYLSFPESQAAHFQPGPSSDISLSIGFRRQSSDITTSTMIQAAWALLMGRYSSTTEVLFGSTVSGRTVPVSGIEEIAGPTISTIPVRVNINPAASIRSFLEQIQRESTDLLQYAHFGLQNIKQISSESCNFQNLLVIQPSTRETEFGILGSRLTFANDSFNTIPLVVQCALKEDAVLATATFDQSRIPSRQMERILQQFGYILQQLIDVEVSGSEDMSIGTLPVISPEDIDEIKDWNSELPETVDACLHETITAKALQIPDSIALCSSWQGEISYSQLIEMSQKLALCLLDNGVQPDMIVPVIFEKNAFAIVSMIAILMAGAAYVPISPDHPRDRRHGLFNQVQAKVIVASSTYMEDDQTANLKIVKVDHTIINSLPSPTKEGRSRLSKVKVTPDSRAYVLFTSGSTGTPKGVVLTHRAVSTSTTGHGRAMGICQDTRVFQFSSYTFDASIAEIFTALTRGSVVCIPSEEERLNDLAGVMTRLKAEWSFLTPSVARLLTPSEVPSLKTLVLGGEAVGKTDIDQWTGKVRLMNGYGPTETCVFCVTHDITAQTSFNTIGKAVSSTSWIVNPTNHDELVPIGTQGELLVSGESLALEYLNDEEKTNKSFITTPKWAELFSGTENLNRFYKTGDIVRYNEEGKIDFISRKDNQIKISGQRIELGEVEHWINEHESVQQVMTLVPSSGPCKKQLIAIIALNVRNLPARKESGIQLLSGKFKELAALQISDLRQSVARQLPAYSLPTIWAFVEDIPLSVSTKLDRGLVSKWVNAMTDETYLDILSLNNKDNARKITTPMERQLQAIWSSVLGLPLDVFDAEQSFFQYGGDSQSELFKKCRSEGIALTVQDVLVSQGLSALAERAETVIKATNANVSDTTHETPTYLNLDNNILRANDLELSSVEHVLPCSHMQERMLEIQEKSPGFYDTEMVFEVIGRQGDKEIDLERLSKAWNEVVNRHEVMRTVLVKHKQGEGKHCQVVLKEVKAKVLLLDQKSSEDSALRVRTKVSAINDYRESGMPHRLTILKTASGKLSMKIEISHVIIDGASLMILFRDLRLAYDGRLGNAAPAPAFGRHIAYLQTSIHDDIAYWNNYCSNSKPCYLPRIQEDVIEGTEADLSVRYVEINITRANELSQFCQRQGISVSNLFCTIWALVLRLHTAKSIEDIIFGYLVSGRDALYDGVEDTVGPLLSALIFRMKLSDSTPLNEVLGAVRNDFALSSTHQSCSMQEIEKNLGLEEPLFNTMVNFRKFPTPKVEEEPSLTIKTVDGIDPFDYDLMLLVKEIDKNWKINLAYWSTKIDVSVVMSIAETFDKVVSSMLSDVEQSTGNLLDSIV